MSDSVQQQQEEPAFNQEDDFQSVRSDVYYITRQRDGRVQGKIELHTHEGLVIVPASVTEPKSVTEEQIREKVSPRRVTISASSHIIRENYCTHYTIKDIECGAYRLTPEEFGEVIWAKQPENLVCCKWINYYYSGGQEKGKYCQLTYFIRIDPETAIPNWKYYCVGDEIKFKGETHEDYQVVRKRYTVLYRVSKVELPPTEHSTELVRKIRNSEKIE